MEGRVVIAAAASKAEIGASLLPSSLLRLADRSGGSFFA